MKYTKIIASSFLLGSGLTAHIKSHLSKGSEVAHRANEIQCALVDWAEQQEDLAGAVGGAIGEGCLVEEDIVDFIATLTAEHDTLGFNAEDPTD